VGPVFDLQPPATVKSQMTPPSSTSHNDADRDMFM
jgi:hypothetical protein